MPPAEIVPALSEASEVVAEGPPSEEHRFAGLRSVKWRINLGILPPSSSVEDLRRVTADARRRYAGLRRRLLVDTHVPKDGSNSPDLVMDNPLSENPDSSWGRFFRSAELEKMVDQDLSRLYPEHGNYFQTSGCQGVLRRILLLWCLRHPNYGYRQGMHELLAPLLYVLHVDIDRLSQVRKLHEDHFIDKFDGLSFHENDLMYNFDPKKLPDFAEDEIGFSGNSMKSLDKLNPEIHTIVLLSDAYGAEGELGVVLSEKFIEHDAYCMFDALMSGAGGAVAMADFFSPSSPAGLCHSALPPVIEASTALYHLLSVVDSSLHSHLVELGVEPQYFALRWLRVLFGREFVLEDLLMIWDEVFAAENSKSEKATEEDACFRILASHRGAYISAIAVSMILYLRSSLLATENATLCLQRLLRFPENVDLKKLIEKAKSLKALALDINMSSSLIPSVSGPLGQSKSMAVRSSSDSDPTKTPIALVNGSYWEEKWRVLHKAEEVKQPAPTRKKGWTERLRLTLSRTGSDPTPVKAENCRKDKRSFTRSLLEDLSRARGSEEDNGKVGNSDVEDDKNSSCTVEERSAGGMSSSEESSSIFSDPTSPVSNAHEDESEKSRDSEVEGQNGHFSGQEEERQEDDKNSSCTFEERSASRMSSSEESSSIFLDPTSPLSNAHEDESEKSRDSEVEDESEKSSVGSTLSIDENESKKSSVGSSLSIDENESEKSGVRSTLSMDENDNHPQTVREDLSDSVSSLPVEASQNSGGNSGPTEKPAAGKLLLGKFQWLWKFGRNAAGEGTSEKGENAPEAINSSDAEEDDHSDATGSFVSCSHHSNRKESIDQNVMGTVRKLGQSMLEHIQVIESVFQQERGQAGSTENLSKNALVGKGQDTAVAALKELRKISNLLSEM